MAEIPISTKGRLRGQYVALVDDCDAEWAQQFAWSADIRKTARPERNLVYVCRFIWRSRHDRTKVYMHREIAERIGAVPSDLMVDHKDANGLNNRRSNIRLATNLQNSMNTSSRPHVTEFKGVEWNRQNRTWRARIKRGDARIEIGSFKTLTEAAMAYDNVARVLFGEFARLNFPESAV